MTKKILSVGTSVRLKNDPGRIGVLTGNHKARAGKIRYQVAFADGKTYQPEYELEVITDENSDLETLVESGRFGRVSDLRRNLSYIQLSGRLANLVYSMDTTNTDFYAYQFKPVLSFLESPSNGLLIADEVGLGKTIEAGLIWTELRARYDSRRLLVVCPAMLREKWRDELRDRFGVDAEIMNAAELLDELKRNKHDIPVGKGIVCSLQGLRPPKQRTSEDQASKSPRAKLASFLDEQSEYDPVVDLLIVDEAHYLRNPESQTAKLGGLLREVSENVLLLSATPVNLRSDDLFHLLKLVDPDYFDNREVFPQILQANEPLQRARGLALDRKSDGQAIKSLLIEAQGHYILAENRQLQELISQDFAGSLLTEDAERIRLANRIEKVNLLRHVVNRTRRVEVKGLRVIRRPFVQFVEFDENGPEWAFYQSVTSAIRQYARQRDIVEGFLLASPQRQVSSCMYAAARSWKRRVRALDEQMYEDFGVEVSEGQKAAPLMEHIAASVLPDVNLDLLRKHDSKYEQFRLVMVEYIRANPEEKVVVFSYFRETLRYLAERLDEDGIKSQVLMGGMRESKYEAINRFRDDPSISVLLSSEVASEGVDLQFSRTLVNYDLPWNPMKVEQRIGRLDRIGQQADIINIWNMCYANTIDHRIYERLLVRLGIFERALGGLEAVLGEKIQALTVELLTQDLTPEQEIRRIDQTAIAIEKIRQDENRLENEASHLIAHGGYILEQVQAAHDFKKRITNDDLLIYVKDFLERHCQGYRFQQLEADQYLFQIQLPAQTAAAFEAFINDHKLHGQTRLATAELVKVEFSNQVQRVGQRIEKISQFHPFIRFISEYLRVRDEAFYPLVAISLAQINTPGFENGRYGFAVNRWSFSGLRIEEELRARVVNLVTGQVYAPDPSWDLVNGAKVGGKDWLDINSEIDTLSIAAAFEECTELLEQDFLKSRSQWNNENEDRVTFQLQSAQRHRDRQLETSQRILSDYRSSGQTKLIPATEGKIKAIKERFKFQEEKLKLRANPTSFSFEVCVGVIDVT